jgi:hypothetical protein
LNSLLLRSYEVVYEKVFAH